jgi:CheY-like chemotaxis protein
VARTKKRLQDEVAVAARIGRDRSGGDPPHVLVVDDDPDVLEALVDVLAVEGYSVRGARDGLEAMEAIADRRPDLIVTDLMMPTMTGFELLGALHDNPELACIPTLIITARGPAEAGRARASQVFRKPLDLDGLLRAIAAHAGAAERHRVN